MSARSHLYVPANNAGRLSKSVDRGADAIIVDLEDGVSQSEKGVGRSNVTAWLSDLETEVEIWVRINSEPEHCDLDLAAAVSRKVTGIIWPKTSSAAELIKLDEKVTALERAIGKEIRIEISALIESGLGVFNALEIARAPRVSRLQIGEADLRADLGASGEGANTALQYARNVVLYASSAAGIHPPVAAVSPDFKDLARFSETTRLFKEWGYFGRACIHPGQVEIVNEIFTPSEQEVERAMDILKRLDEAGGGVAVDAQGRMIDEAIARSARRLLDTSKKIANK